MYCWCVYMCVCTQTPKSHAHIYIYKYMSIHPMCERLCSYCCFLYAACRSFCCTNILVGFLYLIIYVLLGLLPPCPSSSRNQVWQLSGPVIIRHLSMCLYHMRRFVLMLSVWYFVYKDMPPDIFISNTLEPGHPIGHSPNVHFYCSECLTYLPSFSKSIIFLVLRLLSQSKTL